MCLLASTQRHICENQLDHSIGWCEACGLKPKLVKLTSAIRRMPWPSHHCNHWLSWFCRLLHLLMTFNNEQLTWKPTVTNQPSISDWVIQVPLWLSGLGVGLWNRRPRIDPRMVRYTGGSGNLGSPEWKLPALVESGPCQGAWISTKGSYVTNQPSISDWVIQILLWQSGLGVGLWNRWPGINPCTVRYTNNICSSYVSIILY